jgi:NTP pyrophosphatase (non-canonical NTP hydrolase)
MRVGDVVSLRSSEKEHVAHHCGRVGIIISDKGNEYVVRLLEDDVMNGIVGGLAVQDLEPISTSFDSADYAEFVASRLKPLDTDAENLLHCAVGCSTEAGEHLSTAKKVYFYGKDVDKDVYENIVEELGDMLFYLVGACNTIGVTLDEVADENRKKLEKRYPSGYSNKAALERADKAGSDA